jgi:ribosomal protein S8E
MSQSRLCGFFKALTRLVEQKTVGITIKDETKQKTAEEYVDCTKRAKKGNVNEDNIGAIMLAQIPGVSSATSNRRYARV